MDDTTALHHRISELEEQLGLREDIPPQLNLSPQCRYVLGIILKRDVAVTANMVFAVWQGSRTNRDCEPSKKHVEVVVCHLRRALKPHGITIETRHHMGYYMTRAMKEKTRALFRTMRSAA